MGRNRVRYVYAIDLEKQRYRVIRCFNDGGVNFNVLVLADTDAAALETVQEKEPGFQYEPLGLFIHRLFISDAYLTK